MDQEEDVEKQMRKAAAERAEIVGEMLSAYRPCLKSENPDKEMTSSELVDMMSDTITLSTDEMSRLLHQLGYHIRLRGSKYYWQMKEI